MMKDEEKSDKIVRPMVIGRLTRVLFGIGTLLLIPLIGVSTLTGWGTAALVVLGLSFLIGGFTGNPGCELTALPNLVLPNKKRMHCL
jgi:hypothetical protein